MAPLGTPTPTSSIRSWSGFLSLQSGAYCLEVSSGRFLDGQVTSQLTVLSDTISEQHLREESISSYKPVVLANRFADELVILAAPIHLAVLPVALRRVTRDPGRKTLNSLFETTLVYYAFDSLHALRS